MNAKKQMQTQTKQTEELMLVTSTDKILSALKLPSVDGGGQKANHWTARAVEMLETNDIDIICGNDAVDVLINGITYTLPVEILTASLLELYPNIATFQAYCGHSSKGFPTLLQYKVSLAASKMSVSAGKELAPWQKLALELKQSGLYEEITTQSNIETIYLVVSKDSLQQFKTFMETQKNDFRYKEVKDFHSKGKYKNQPDMFGYYIQSID